MHTENESRHDDVDRMLESIWMEDPMAKKESGNRQSSPMPSDTGTEIPVKDAANELGVTTSTVVRALKARNVDVIRRGLGTERKRLFVTRDMIDLLKEEAGSTA